MGGNSTKVLKPEELKSDSKVIVYGHEDCPYCVKVKSIFQDDFKFKIDFRNIMLSKEFASDQEALGRYLKYDTIPMVFINNKFYGGCSEIKELVAKGELTQLIS